MFYWHKTGKVLSYVDAPLVKVIWDLRTGSLDDVQVWGEIIYYAHNRHTGSMEVLSANTGKGYFPHASHIHSDSFHPSNEKGAKKWLRAEVMRLQEEAAKIEMIKAREEQIKKDPVYLAQQEWINLMRRTDMDIRDIFRTDLSDIKIYDKDGNAIGTGRYDDEQKD